MRRRGREIIGLTPFLLTAILAAVLSTAAVILFWYLAANPPGPPPVPPAGPPPVPRHLVNLIVAVGVCVVSWVAVLVGVCYDQMLRQLDHVGERLDQTAARLHQEAEEAGVFRGMAIEAERSSRDEDETGPPDEDPRASSGGGGRILPFRT